MVRRILAALGAVLFCQPLPAWAGCREALLAPVMPAPRPVEPGDLARLRDFGGPENFVGGKAPFSLSPDGTEAALVLRRGDPETDRFCVGLVVVPLRPGGTPRLVDLGGEPILARGDVRGIPDLPVGSIEGVTPAWSPDGAWLVYLRRDKGLTQVWRARTDGGGAWPVLQGEEEVRAVRWAPDGQTLLVTTRPMAEARAAIDAEGRRGFLYDHRFWTLSEAKPRPPLPIAFVERRIDPETGHEAGPIPTEATKAPPLPPGARLYTANAKGAGAWLEPVDPSQGMGSSRLIVEAGPRRLVCESPACQATGALWWQGPRDLLLMASGTPENGGVTSFLRWRIGRDAAPKTLFATVDAWFGCQALAGELVCAHETADRPRVIARLDPSSGRSSVIFDPNPEFAALAMGKVQRLRWTASDGVAGYGDLVLPPTHRPGEKHPLVVVQYQSRGFLRGGTGDEYPVHALAARGFAVFSFNRVAPAATGSGAADIDSFIRIGMTGFAERRRMLRAIETGIDQAIALGVVDPDRIGISGLSDGAASVQFALIHSSRFRAAAMSSCCDDPSSVHFAAGPGYSEAVERWGYPGPNAPGAAFWNDYSLAANAGRIKVPILFQLPDDEYRLGLETYVTLNWHKAPVEMHVFPDAFHQKWRPAQRLAVYERGIDWFDYWLNGRADPDPLKAGQYRRWDALRDRQAVAERPSS
ncbi:Atxe2 family lasso peptide isopeptidase [Sphingomonas sp. FW199]|uniref:Atxe2 family lasso peptide isopeptidase n=1 Tax=Sphingomonas sp. FW199 TaxID=3400217 RepID=UPI003CF01234